MSQNSSPSSLAGKLAIVTGSSSGIGKEIARGLAQQGAEVVMACRTMAKAETVRAELQASAPGGTLSVMELDLASLGSIRAFAKAFQAKHPSLDILVNNAGGWTTEAKKSADGIELTWATNVVGPEFLTQLLLPALKAAPKARIVNVASTAAGGLDLDDVEFSKRKYSGFSSYSTTKQANRMLTWHLAKQLQGSSVTANAMTPGFVHTDFNRDAKGVLGMIFGVVTPIMAKTPAKGADTAVWLASSPEVEGVSGKFWENRKELACKFRSDTAAIERLAALCKSMAEGVAV
jgi:NAD(P)-dependent dehydrogenase (short-subunit alcohol dehydrogenase family)